jgi:antirestriction protein ArdC
MTPREQSNGPAPVKRDHRQEVTDSIVKTLEDGVAPWQKPWESAGMPFNPTTDKAYRGGNAVHLMATGLDCLPSGCIAWTRDMMCRPGG